MELRLAITLDGTNVILSWPTNGAVGFEVQSTGEVSPAEGWQTVTNVPGLAGDQFEVTLPRSVEAQFYRLRK
jgi:hypothetical protein